MKKDGEPDPGQPAIERREFFKSAAAVGSVVLTGPILGVAGADVAVAQAAITKAAKKKVGITPFAAPVYGGGFIRALNNAFSYARLYKADGTPDTSKGSTIAIFLAQYPNAGSYDGSKFGTFAGKLPQAADWIDVNGQPIRQDKYEAEDAPNIFGSIKQELSSRIDANLRTSKPMPMWLFVGSSGMKKEDDPSAQGGYRFISTTGKIVGNPQVDHIIMGILCPING